MKSILLFFVGLCLLATTLQAQVAPDSTHASKTEAQEYVLSAIEVRGAEYTDYQSVVLLSGLVTGRKIQLPGTDISHAINKLWKQDIFSDVQIKVSKIDGNLVTLLIELTERPKITHYSFRGVRKGQAEDLRQKIQFVRGTIFTEPKRRSAIRIIKNFYQEKGYLNTKVDFDTKLDTLNGRNGVSIVIKIDKGPRVKVKKLVIEGNKLVPTRIIRKKLKNTKQRAFYRFWKRSKYTKGKFQEDKEKLMTYFGASGFRDAELTFDTIQQVNPKNVILTLKLYEGPKYRFGNITFVGNTKYPSEVLGRVLNIKKGDIYNKELLDKRLTLDPGGYDVSSLYLDNGYLFYHADPVEVGVAHDSINLEIRMVEGPQATNDRITLEGNEQTADHVILREIRTLPGEKFDRSALIRSQREIIALGYFDPEKINMIPTPNQEKGTVDIKYVVAERSNDQITLQGGYSGNTYDVYGNKIGGGILATVGLQFNNFSTRKIFKPHSWRPIPKGDGQKLSLQVQSNGSNYQNFAISFLEPWLGGKKPNSLGVNTNYSVQNSPTIGYHLRIYGLSVDLGRRLKFPDDYFRSYTSFAYRNYDLKNAASVFPTIGNGNINIYSVKETIERSSIDAPIFSRSGSLVSLSLEATPPYSLFSHKTLQQYDSEGTSQKFKFLEFYKIKFETQTFLSITKGKLPLVLYTRMRFGFLGGYTPAIPISPFERFYLGGDGLTGYNVDGREIIGMRGYASANIGPVNGATAYDKFTIELRQPVTLEQSATVWVHVFAEAGNAFSDFSEFNPFELKRSVGVGLRAFLPMFGLLGVDYGYGLDNVQYNGSDIGGAHFHFVIGQQF